MEYLIGVLMSLLPWWPAILVAGAFGGWVAYMSGRRGKRVFGFGVFASLCTCIGLTMGAATSPSNTYKVKAERTSNPPVSITQQEPEKGIDAKIKLDEDMKRKEHFDDLVNWKNRSE